MMLGPAMDMSIPVSESTSTFEDSLHMCGGLGKGVIWDPKTKNDFLHALASLTTKLLGTKNL